MVRWLLILVLVAGPLRAEQSDSSNTLEQINLKVEEQSSSLKIIAERQEKLEGELKGTESSLAKLRIEEESLVTEQKGIEERSLKAEAEIKRLTAEGERLKQFSLKRLKVLYIDSGAGFLESLVLSSRGQELGTRAVYVKHLREFDRSTIEKYKTLKEAEEKRKSELKKLAAERSVLLKKVAEQRATIQNKVSEQNALLKNITREKTGLEETLQGLRAQALRLETVVSSLTSGSDEYRSAQDGQKSVTVNEPKLPIESYQGAGLFRQKGSLTPPFQGKVVQGFGRVKRPEFADLVVNKGVEFKGDARSEVIAIAPGRVIFSGKMPGYGNIVIVDHGERYYSLYGRLSKAIVTVGEAVSRAETIAFAGESEDRGNFYFEIRQNGSPVNPKSYFPKW